jgi:hypothetical protein
VDTGDYIYDMNIYHDALLCWSFRKALQAIHLPNALSYYELFQASDTSLHAGIFRFVVLKQKERRKKNISVSLGHWHSSQKDQYMIVSISGWYTRGRFSGIKNGYFLHTNEERITKKKIETTVSSSLSR